MDKRTTEHELVTQAIAAAQALGLDLELAAWEPPTGAKHADSAIDLRAGKERIRYLVEVRKGMRPATLGAVLLQLQELEQLGGPVMLVTDYVTPQLAEALKERGVAFLDAAGNAYINAPPLLVWQKPQKDERYRAKGSGSFLRSFADLIG